MVVFAYFFLKLFSWKVTGVWFRLTKRWHAMGFERWREVHVWSVQHSREEAAAQRQRGWGTKMLARVLRQNHGACVRRAFRLWSAASEEAVRHEVIVQRVLRRWARAGVAHCFDRWAGFVERRRHARVVASKVFGRLMNGRLFAAWGKWEWEVRSAQVAEEERQRLEEARQLEALEERLHRLAAAHEELRQEHVEVTSVRDRLRKSHGELQLQHEAVKREVEGVQQQHQELQDLYVEVQQHRDVLHTEHSGLRVQHEALGEELEAQKSAHESVLVLHGQLEAQHQEAVERHQEAVERHQEVVVSKMLSRWRHLSVTKSLGRWSLYTRERRHLRVLVRSWWFVCFCVVLKVFATLAMIRVVSLGIIFGFVFVNFIVLEVDTRGGVG